ncbi:hypothetical protein [Microbulbifer discodermiae]|uniref:hypothetical protein n=1 Tax=Microbulbifer sp. 2201CG32-9 TaxID=3232309 RepID=UPI00345BC242
MKRAAVWLSLWLALLRADLAQMLDCFFMFFTHQAYILMKAESRSLNFGRIKRLLRF